MSTIAPPPSHSSLAPEPSTVVNRTGRRITVMVMLISLVVMGSLQHGLQTWHHKLVQNTGSEAKLSNLDSFSLALLLGGFRGPLVMMLWSSSESQKQNKDLEDFDSKIELIRLLQPEFDTVHIFQMWNKAYNISVQMANNSDKYATIVDALEYGYRVNAQHPDDMNLLSSIGRIFFDLLPIQLIRAGDGTGVHDRDRCRVEVRIALDFLLRAVSLDALRVQAGLAGEFAVVQDQHQGFLRELDVLSAEGPAAVERGGRK